MFTGIIESMGSVLEILPNNGNLSFWIESPISAELKADQSVSHDGVCLTVDQLAPGRHRVTAVEETLQKTTLERWVPGYRVNLERSLRIGDRLDGHLVQGHVDSRAVCRKRKEKEGSWEFEFEFPGQFAGLIIEKGSVAVNGISLTCFRVKKKSFRVAIIPYTFEHTNISHVREGDTVNIEFDIVAKFLENRSKMKSK